MSCVFQENIADTRVDSKKDDFLERKPGMAPAVRFNLDTPITYSVHITS
jgi:hypothetical protein